MLVDQGETVSVTGSREDLGKDSVVQSIKRAIDECGGSSDWRKQISAFFSVPIFPFTYDIAMLSSTRDLL
jgi:hypothetical protein